MSILDDLMRKAGAKAQNAVKTGVAQAVNTVKNAAASSGSPNVEAVRAAAEALAGSGVSIAEGKTSQGFPSFTVTFDSLPAGLDELKACPLSDLKLPCGTAALTVAALNRYEEDKAAAHEMVNYLRGPRPMSPFEEQFLRDRLAGKMYVIRSYWKGTSPANGYTPELPYSVTFFEDPNTYQNEGYCRLNCTSSGADSPRQITLRKKESTGEWFLWENYLLPDIRVPAEADPWA